MILKVAVQIKAAIRHEIDTVQNERGHYGGYIYNSSRMIAIRASKPSIHPLVIMMVAATLLIVGHIRANAGKPLYAPIVGSWSLNSCH